LYDKRKKGSQETFKKSSKGNMVIRFRRESLMGPVNILGAGMSSIWDKFTLRTRS